MKILYIDIADLLRHIPDTLSFLGHDVDMFSGFSFGADYDTSKLYDLLEEKIKSAKAEGRSYDLAISFNYFYVISEVCRQHEIIYCSWIYDSPQAELFHPTLSNDNNRVFVFDRMLLGRLQKYAPEANLFFMSLAGNTKQIENFMITDEDEGKYTKDISFVGGLYENNVYNQTYGLFDDDQKERLGKYLMDNLCNWKDVRPWPELDDDLIRMYSDRSPRSVTLAYDMPLSQYFGCMILSRKLSEMERLTILNRLSEICPVTIYTNSKSPYLETINGSVMPPVDYRNDMLKVFHLSRINLNMTLPSIESGIPLRVFDIMSVGGFCLTNYQKEADDLFIPGKDIETYTCREELFEKAAYYLLHDDARIRIAVNGYIRIRDEHNYVNKLNEMLKICFQ